MITDDAALRPPSLTVVADRVAPAQLLGRLVAPWAVVLVETSHVIGLQPVGAPFQAPTYEVEA